MPDLINILESFNRKERFFLVSQALGKPTFELSDDFRQKLGDTVGVSIPTEKVFVAMDYHLNWVHASLVLAHYPGEGNEQERVAGLNTGAIKRNSEDVDLLVAFQAGEHHHLIFVEAKGYDTDGLAGFKKSQLNSKVKQRLEEIFNDGGVSKYADAKAYYCLASGYKPQNLKSDDWPKWDGEPIKWLELILPDERLVLKYNASVWKVRRGEKSEQIIPPKGKA